MPSCAKFLKEILPNKGKLKEHEIMVLTEECSAAIQRKLLTKLKVLGSFSIPCLIGNVFINRTLYDLRSSASLIPFFLCEKLDLGGMRLTTISLQLMNHYIEYTVGVSEDVPIKVGDLYCQ